MFADTPVRWTDPATWPWMFYVWAAFALAGLAKPAWSWLRRKRAAGWPIADGRIESVEITKPSFSFTTKRGYYVAEIGYSYSFAGSLHSGRYKREFPTEHEAEEFVRDLQGKPVAVQCNSTSPSSSALLDPDIGVLLQNRAPALVPSHGGELRSRLDQAVPLGLHFTFWHRSRRQLVGSSRGSHGTDLLPEIRTSPSMISYQGEGTYGV